MSQHFLHYTVTSTLERHAASQTYLATHDHEAGHTVVLKIFYEPGFINISEQEKFLQESEKFSTLSATHIVPMLEAGIERDQAYIVSEYMPNGSLRVRLDRTYPQRLPFQQAMTIITQIGQSLAYLHARYLLHGQLKPEQILFDANGHAILSDPYCSTRPAPWDTDNENASDAYRYLAPEQFEGEHSFLSDQYALCCVAYELLTGRPPFTLRDPQALEDQQKHILPSPLSPILPDLAPSIEQAILKGLAKEPSQRHADITTFLSAIQASKAATTPDLPLPRAKRRTKSLAPSIAIAPPMPAKKAATDQSGRTNTPVRDDIFAPLAKTKKPATEIVIPPAQLADDDQYLDDFMAIPPSQLQKRNKRLDDAINIPPSPFQDQDQHLDDIFNMPQAKAQESIAGTLDELLQEMAIEDELLIPERNVHSAPAETYKAERQSTLSEYAEDEYEDLISLDHPRNEYKSLAPQSYAQDEDVTPLPAAAMSDDNFVDIATPLASVAPFAQATSEPVAKSTATKLSAHIFPISHASMQSGALFSKKTVLAGSAALLMIVCLILYSTLAVAAPKSSSLVWSATVPSLKSTSTVDSLGILPPTTATRVPTAAIATPKATATSRPKATATPRPTPTALPVYIPPAPTPTVTPVPGPSLIYSNTLTAQATTAGNVVGNTIDGLTITNFRIEADIVIQGDGGGIFFRGNGASSYRLRISTDGSYDLVTGSKSLASSSNSAIKQGNGASNHITIVAKGTHITISVNATIIIEIQDSTYSTGNVGTMATDFADSTTSTCALKIYSY